ncbi:MAG: hypothetical protein BWX88_03424 [Planctomycetes bacterium ADurb.Bin126]|nr:MAG: hypothetical protein BWX88_03424 [Planctomycetes bacterium ADurb.Bin126]HOD81749.1 transglutaminase family protein [Phycisphaerae bacterium]HQL74709.1 transglutaminase family protein [Phycisphaerae bacterium]
MSNRYRRRSLRASQAVPAESTPDKIRVPTLGEVLFFSTPQIARLRIEFLNLLCASGLPDTRDLNIHACLKKLDEWAQHVKQETERNLHRFQDNASEYRNSEAFWRAGMMVTVLQQDLGVRYNPDCINTEKFNSSGEGFIHGILRGEGGTCANLPILYAAVGRKLGYPIYVCCAKRHLFNRWATRDGKECFNIEGSGKGFSSLPDDYYMKARYTVNPREVRLGFYLRNLDPAEELAIFMATRGHCLRDRGLLLDAIVAYAHAHRLGPFQPPIFYSMMEAIRGEMHIHAEGKAPNSYREWEGWDKIPRPDKRILTDEFDRVLKSPPVFRPKEAIVIKGFREGENHGI